jgi:methylated-DNA-[protein]-cysteine S-methyltransferase
MENLYCSTGNFDGIKIDVLASSKGIREIFINKKTERIEFSNATKIHPDDPYLFGIFLQLTEYFKRKRKTFELPLEIIGTEFQKKVWDELLKIPYGKTISYKELSLRIGDLKSIRAVGKANGSNPLPIVIPCHRVIGTNGKLVGYGGGLGVKEKLLRLEGCINADLFS